MMARKDDEEIERAEVNTKSAQEKGDSTSRSANNSRHRYQRGGPISSRQKDSAYAAKDDDGVAAGSRGKKGIHFHMWCCDIARQRNVMASLLFALILGTAYYTYLNRLYLIDEVYEGGALRELRMVEKTTIRVAVIADKSSLQDFLGHYSLCQAVNEVQVLWPRDHPLPRASDFQYAHTHSLVSFEHSGHDKLFSSHLPIDTESVLLLDADVRVSCRDIAFTVSVWRSGSNSVVGFFPRLHVTSAKSSSSPGFISGVLGWEHVWLQGAYSIMLSGGAMVSSRLLSMTSPLEESRSDDFMNYEQQNVSNMDKKLSLPGVATMKSNVSQSFTNILSTSPECNSVAISLWCAANPVCNPPIWVKPSSLTLRSDVSLPVTVTKKSQDMCVALLSKELRISDLPVSSHKAVRASDQLFW